MKLRMQQLKVEVAGSSLDILHKATTNSDVQYVPVIVTDEAASWI